MTAVLCIGKFDALHLGHRALAERGAAIGAGGRGPAEPALGAAEAAEDVCLLGFTGMAEVLGWPARQPLIAPSDRARVLARWSAELGARIAQAALPFAEIRPLSAAEFLGLLRRRFGARALVVGEDFRGGRGREAGVDELAPLAAAIGLRLEVVPHRVAAGAAISSSRVRAALAQGEVALARACLGRPHRVVGAVLRGDGRGRGIGFPTANCGERENQEPAPGVYAAVAEVDGMRCIAAVNVGRLPTIAADRPLTVEAHLLGFARDCYGERIAIDFLTRLRDEQRFPSLEALQAQIASDVLAARAAAERDAWWLEAS